MRDLTDSSWSLHGRWATVMVQLGAETLLGKTILRLT